MNIRDTIETQLNVLERFVPNVPKSYRKSKFLMLGNLMPFSSAKGLRSNAGKTGVDNFRHHELLDGQLS